ncbi:MAG TPA: tRNA lysidine(34) synthetase TilS, partial [Chloroflexaceae bacterium]|nr:tRNA lysidine(34) synthetase TilS [Chloroflexaceae bacterium]
RPGGPPRPRPRRGGLMAAARRARYAFLAETALAVGAVAVAVAHQADDQAETVLLHAMRGAGLAGLRGMRPEVPWAEWGAAQGAAVAGCALLRPLLAVTRDEIEAYCERHSLAPFDDPSNSSPRYARARARRLLRALAEENPRVVQALGRTALVSADEYDFLQARLDTAWPDLTTEAPGAVALRREAWAALHPALQRHALRRAAARLGQAELSLEQVEAARALAAKPGRRTRLGPRLWLEVDQSALTLTSHPSPLAAPTADLAATGERGSRAQRGGGTTTRAPQIPFAELPLAAPGAIALGGGWRCVVGGAAPARPGPWWLALDAEALDGPLALRRRRPGDRFRPAGGRGSRRLQDFFVDRRVPRGLRDAWPILATPGAVVWVAGLRADGRFVAGAATRSTIWVGFVQDEEGSDAS